MLRTEVLPLAEPAPAAAYATCRRMLRRHDPTYYLAVSGSRKSADQRSTRSTASSGAPTRSSTGSGSGLPPDERRAALDAWQGELEAGWRPDRPTTR